MHATLARQLKRFLGRRPEELALPEIARLTECLRQHDAPSELQNFAAGLTDFIGRIDQAYAQSERDLNLRSRSLQLSSEEFQRLNETLRAELATRENAIAELKELVSRLQSTPIAGTDGKQSVGYLAMLVDQVSSLVHRQEMQQAELKLAASVFEHANEGITITDANGVILDVNQAFTRITGYAREEVRGRNPRLLQSGRQGPEFYAAMWQALAETGQWSGEVWNRRKDGELFAELLTISAIKDAAGNVQNYVGLFFDITTLKTHQQQLEHIAHFDALTNLPNRVLLADRLKQAMAQSVRRQTQVAVVYLDLDGFKNINDTFGHSVGDKLLVELAERMGAALRDGDTLSRLGGDEFVSVLLDLEDRESSLPILQRLLKAAADPVKFDSMDMAVSASIGVSFFPQTETVDADQLMRQADQAMYQAKQAGKNRYHLFDTERDRVLRGRHESIERVREALENREFVLFYQPKVNLRSGEVIGAEALLRWEHPELGLLAPVMFLPLIEDHELIRPIGDWVIETALEQLDAWHAMGLILPVSVNVAGMQLQAPDFLSLLKAKLLRHPKVAHQLELEVLETSALNDVAQVSELIGACKVLGVEFALDDFGTGYSSLTYLKRLPAQTLKIDQSFVRDMLEDPEDLAIIDGIVGLAESFGRSAIAEGMESYAHGEILLRLGCEQAQGYAIARPMPAKDLAHWIATWKLDSALRRHPRIHRDKLPVLFAMVEHRAWVAALFRHLREQQTVPPPLDHHQCRFGLWLNKSGLRQFAGHPGLERLLRLHELIHRQATVLLDLKKHGPEERVVILKEEITALRDELLEQLEHLIDAPQDS